jgi:hypothetical protein
VNKDDIDDAQLDAFLNGTDELSRRLRGLPQGVPPAQLDDAILRHVEQALEAQARPAAANDPAPVPHLKPLSWRWRVPAALAATVLVGLFAQQSFDMSRSAKMAETAPVETRMIEEVAVAPSVQADIVAAPPPAKPSAMAVPPPPAVMASSEADRERAAPAPVLTPAPATPVLEYKASAEPPRPVETPVMAAPAEAAPAPAAEALTQRAAGTLADKALQAGRTENRYANDAAAAQKRESLQAVQVLGSRIRLNNAESNVALDPKAWLERIEKLLGDGASKEAVAEWAKFRAAFPDYQVPDTTTERIRAASQP